MSVSVQTLAVPVQTLLRLFELSVDVPELALNQRMFHVEHRVHHLQPNNGGEGQKDTETRVILSFYQSIVLISLPLNGQPESLEHQDRVLIKISISASFHTALL